MDVTFCAICHLELEEFGLAAQIWEDLCTSLVIEEGVLVIDPDEFLSIWPVIEFLERKGYIVTTDVEDGLYLLKSVGLVQEEQGGCWVCKRGTCPH